MNRYDLDEIAPGRFVVRDARAITLLKTEGDLAGRMFTLRSWRREGLLARLRDRGFRVRTLDDRVRALPQLPSPPQLGAAVWHDVARGDRWSLFDPAALEWQPLQQETRAGGDGVMVRSGQVIRRRRGRGAASYALVGAGRALHALDETEALLMGYAQAAAVLPALRARRIDEGIVLPENPLPPPQRQLLRGLALDGHDGIVLSQEAWPIAQEVYACLGVRLKLDHD